MTPSNPPGVDPLHILVVHAELPLHDRHSGSLRLFRLLETMAEDGHDITFVARNGLGQERYCADLAALGIDVHPVDPDWLRERGVNAPLPELDLPGMLERERFDVAYLFFYEIAEQYVPVIRRHSPLTRVVVDTVDVHYVREMRGAELAGDAAQLAAAERTRERERAVYGAGDALVAVSDDDAEALRELAPDIPVSVVSNVHDEEPAGPPMDERSGLIFVANFAHAPNVDAIVDFHASSWPLIRERLPGVQLWLVGSDPPPLVQAMAAEDVTVTGWVDQTVPYVDAARVSIAPLRYGAGVKGKIGEAMSHGLPVVTTPIGAEGMDLVDGEHVLIAESPEDFAAAVARLYDDAALWQRLSDAGRDHVERTLGRTAARNALRSLFEAAARRQFVTEFKDAEALEATLAGYLAAFEPGDPVSLVVTTAGDPEAAFDAAGAALERLGRDVDSIPDVAITRCNPGAPLPSRAVCADSFELPAPRERTRRRIPRAAVAVYAPLDSEALKLQLDALRSAALPSDVELVIAAGGTTPAIESLLASSGARIVRTPLQLGRRAAWQLAAQATSAPHVLALSPLALPQPGFVDPMIDALAAGAAAVNPVTAAAHGFRTASDGSVWPLTSGDDTASALALDCAGFHRELLAGGLPELPSGEGHAEAQLGRWAMERGGIAVASGARVTRVDAGDATVIICTRNRVDELPEGIELLIASGARDVVIVDNGSNDGTAELAAELAAKSNGIVTVANEERPGLCHARNAGAAAARSDLLLYIDDDARPAPGWRQHITWALTRPGVVNAGGPICALWPDERPEGWPGRDLEPLLSVLDRGDFDQDLTPPDIVYGANWSVRRDALRAAGGFDPAFGPSDQARINGDEASVAWRLHHLGIGGTRYAAAGAVGHRIPPSRVDDSFLRQRSMCVGVERARHAHALGQAPREKLVADAAAAAQRLLSVAPVIGDATPADVLETIGRAPLPLNIQIYAADALGELAACVALVGETEVAAEEMRLAISPADVLAGRLDQALSASSRVA